MTLPIPELSRRTLSRELEFKETLAQVLEGIDPAQVFVLELLNMNYERDNVVKVVPRRFIEINHWIRDVCASFRHVKTLKLSNFIHDNYEISDNQHYNRKVYYRIYKEIWSRISSDTDRAPLLSTKLDSSSSPTI